MNWLVVVAIALLIVIVGDIVLFGFAGKEKRNV